jgi:hypothetical protein
MLTMEKETRPGARQINPKLTRSVLEEQPDDGGGHGEQEDRRQEIDEDDVADALPQSVAVLPPVLLQGQTG